MSEFLYIKDGIPTLNPKNLSHIKKTQIVDVRTSEEYNGGLGHIENAQLITLGPDLDNFIKNYSKDKDEMIIFVCRSGVRSGKATTSAIDAGLTNVYNLEGGMLLWNSLEMPIKYDK